MAPLSISFEHVRSRSRRRSWRDPSPKRNMQIVSLEDGLIIPERHLLLASCSSLMQPIGMLNQLVACRLVCPFKLYGRLPSYLYCEA